MMVKMLEMRRGNNYDENENFNRFARRNSEGERWHCRIFIIGGSFFYHWVTHHSSNHYCPLV